MYVPEAAAQPLSPTSEQRLQREARAGSREAFDSMLAPVIEPAYSIAYSILRDRGESEDAVQEAAVKAWRKLDQLRDGGTFRSWFFSIVVNECRMTRRQRWSSVVKLAEVERGSAAMEEAVVQNLDLRQRLGRLPDGDRTIVLLHFYLDLPMEEVGRIVGLSTSAAKSRLYRALQRISERDNSRTLEGLPAA